jgi:hypothetical protein
MDHPLSNTKLHSAGPNYGPSLIPAGAARAGGAGRAAVGWLVASRAVRACQVPPSRAVAACASASSCRRRMSAHAALDSRFGFDALGSRAAAVIAAASVLSLCALALPGGRRQLRRRQVSSICRCSVRSRRGVSQRRQPTGACVSAQSGSGAAPAAGRPEAAPARQQQGGRRPRARRSGRRHRSGPGPLSPPP